MDQPLYGTPTPHTTPLGPLSPPLHRASSAAQTDVETLRRLGAGLQSGDFYQRMGHPNCRQFESLAAAREGADGAVAFASGMAAMSGAILALVRAGDRILVPHEVYGGTAAFVTQDLPRFGVTVERFYALDANDLRQRLATPAKLVVLETPINPTLRLVDLAACASLCRAHGALSLADGTFAPPPIQRPLALGVDLVVHSATKFYGGHSDVLAGVVCGRHEHMRLVEQFRRRTGGILAPDPAWLLCRSWPTLDLRIEAQQASAAELAERLQALVRAGLLADAIYPGLASHPDRELAQRQMQGGGTMVSFVVPGGLDRSRRVFDAFELIARGPSLGSVESLASLPAYTTHAPLTAEERKQAGIPDGLLRISVGLEGADALARDIEQAVRRTV
jgi:methionine-gamma-lyase